jgi:CubicO group peptidase (beta-lactamase class C family)
MTAPNLSKTRLARLRPILEGHVEQGDVPGAVVAISRRGETHLECAGLADIGTATPMRRDTLFRIASMTKPVTAVAALMLVEEGRLRLDDPVDLWLPELADRRVMRSLAGDPQDTVPANRPITLRDLLTFRLGFGAIMAPPGTYPIQKLVSEAGLAPGAMPPTVGPEAWMGKLAAAPLLHQPGERWMYHTGSDILGVLIARVSGMDLGVFFKQRIFAPLGMKDTGFHAAPRQSPRLGGGYSRAAIPGHFDIIDPAAGGAWSRPPVFESGGGGLLSTADDYLLFARMLLDMGRSVSGERILSRANSR